MSESAETYVEEPESIEDDEDLAKRERRLHILIRVLIIVAIAVLILIALLLLKRCDARAGVVRRTPTVEVPVVVDSSTVAIENKIYSALRGTLVAKGERLSDMVYIVKVAQGDLSAKITLSNHAEVLARNPQTDPAKLAAMCEDVVFEQVPEVGRVTVLDTNDATVISTRSRR